MFCLQCKRKLLLLACWLVVASTLHPADALEQNESFPLHRPLHNMREAAIQTVGRDGPRYPDDGFFDVVRKYRATPAYNIAPPAADPNRPVPEDCSGGYAVLTMANQLAMETLMPLLLESLHRIELPPVKPDVRNHLARHSLVIGINTAAYQACVRLRRHYKNGCLTDQLSGLYDGDNRLPDWKALHYGMAKLRYIVNVLSSGTAVLYVDADVVFLRNPFPDLLPSSAEIAVVTAPVPCGTQPTKTDWAFLEGSTAAGATGAGHHNTSGDARGSGGGAEPQQLELRRRGLLADGDGAVLGYAPGITFYRSTPGVMRCTYSLLLDMLNAVLRDGNATVLEQEHFASFMPACAEALGLELVELPPHQYVTACGADVGSAVRAGGGEVVAVHASGVFGASLTERLPLMQSLMGITSNELVMAADGEANGKNGGTSDDDDVDDE